MRIIFLSILILLTGIGVKGQSISDSDRSSLKKIELFLQRQADSIINSQNPETRFTSSKELIQGLVIALKTKHSFYYTFDSVQISKIYSPDSTFKIFTWQVCRDSNYFRQFGAIQMKTNDGSLKLIPLFDGSNFTDKPTDSVRQNNNWIGAIYYRIIMKNFNNKNYYTLLGSDANNSSTNKKWIDILTFDEQGKPQFGRNCFIYPNDGIKPPQPCYRFCLEYKSFGGARLFYDDKLDEIIFDHLVSDKNDISIKSTLVPYGDYQGFKWHNGKWYFTAQPYDALEFDDKPKTFLKPLPEIEKEEKKKNKKRDKLY